MPQLEEFDTQSELAPVFSPRDISTPLESLQQPQRGRPVHALYGREFGNCGAFAVVQDVKNLERA
jgi:hypothetical protein